jgi:hypothetical protein
MFEWWNCKGNIELPFDARSTKLENFIYYSSLEFSEDQDADRIAHEFQQEQIISVISMNHMTLTSISISFQYENTDILLGAAECKRLEKLIWVRLNDNRFHYIAGVLILLRSWSFKDRISKPSPHFPYFDV